MRWKQELWPEWEIVCDIGAGAYGTVYKMRRQDIGGTYYSALKVITFPHNRKELELLQNQQMTDNQISQYYHEVVLEISKEFALMERLKGNTNIVSYEDHKIVPHEDGMGWDILIRMELLMPLPEYLEQHEINEKEVCKLGIDICNALILCEKERIIHRDVKPGNIFVSDHGDYKLGDFSLAKQVEFRVGKSSPQGTYTYMAPEVYKGQGYDYSIDTYSLGLILYRLLNRGRGPFQPLPPEIISPEISEEANQKRLHTEILPKPVDASPAMAAIILKACAYKPEKRYKSPGELQKILMKNNSSKTAMDVKKQISYYIKKAATVLQDSYEELLRENNEVSDTDEIEEYAIEKNIVQREKRIIINDLPKKKEMTDFFTSAGDL